MPITARYVASRLKEPRSFPGTKEATMFVMAEYAGLEREIFGCLFLDARHRLLSFDKLFSVRWTGPTCSLGGGQGGFGLQRRRGDFRPQPSLRHGRAFAHGHRTHQALGTHTPGARRACSGPLVVVKTVPCPWRSVATSDADAEFAGRAQQAAKKIAFLFLVALVCIAPPGGKQQAVRTEQGD